MAYVKSRRNTAMTIRHYREKRMTGKFEVYHDKAGEYRFQLKAANGQNILASEGYKAKASCLSGIESVKSNAPDDSRYAKADQDDTSPCGTVATNPSDNSHAHIPSDRL